MNLRKSLEKTWILLILALAIGLVVGSLATRWHYKKMYKDSVTCGSISYYGKDGKSKIYSDSSCTQ